MPSVLALESNSHLLLSKFGLRSILQSWEFLVYYFNEQVT